MSALVTSPAPRAGKAARVEPRAGEPSGAEHEGALALDEVELLAPVYPTPRLELVSGRGAWVEDAAGRRYLDFVGGIAVNALGHAPPGFARALGRQLRSLVQVSNHYAHRPGVALARALVATTGYERVFFCNSGAESVEAALKFARARAHALGRPGRGVLAFTGGFHGRTGFALSATANPSYRAPFEPLVPGIRFAPYDRVEALDEALDDTICAVLVEPVQGEAGAVPASADFLRALRARTSATGAVLVADEVQCGMGRTGRLLALEHAGVRADLTVLAKALGGGYPLGAVLLDGETARSLSPGLHGSTLGGNPVAAAAGLWMLERIARPGFLAAVRRRGRRLAAGLEAIASRRPAVCRARGLGLLQALVLDPGAPFTPAEAIAAARGHGLLVVRGGERAIRLLPPLNVNESEIDEALRRLEAALAQLESGSATPENEP